MIAFRYLLPLAAALLMSASHAGAQNGGFDTQSVALIYHKISGQPLDLQANAEASAAVRRATSFDRPDVLKGEIARLQALLDAADSGSEFTVTVNDSVSDYDHDHAEFSINLFRPGYFVPFTEFRQQYQIVFANAESARAIPMPRDEAREFDARLRRYSRRVNTEVRFRVTGQGDPAGAVTGQRVVRAEILSARILDAAGRVLHIPEVQPEQEEAGAAGAPFDTVSASIAGLRLGVKAADLEATLIRLAGPVRRSAGTRDKSGGLYAGALRVNEMGCMNVPGRRNPSPGAVCATAWFDEKETVRAIRVERVFPWMPTESFRKMLTGMYGPVASASRASRMYTLAWGQNKELVAQYLTNDDAISLGNNSRPNIRVTLHLTDAQIASKTGQ